MQKIIINDEIYIIIKEKDYKEKTDNYNSGNYNSGRWNSGDCNSGDCNSGDYNSGNYNSGDYNSGRRNSGNYNSGDYNSGNYNSGDWNSGDCNSGIFNTDVQFIRMFNKETNIKYDTDEYNEIDFPDFLRFSLTTWITAEEMTEKEKKEHPEYKTTGGYLMTLGYKEAFRNSWINATDEDKRKILKLPNFDNDIFKEISGIDVVEELGLMQKCNCIYCNGINIKKFPNWN